MYSPKIFFFSNCDNNTGLIELLTLKKYANTFLWNILTLQGSSDRNINGYIGYPHEQKTGHDLWPPFFLFLVFSRQIPRVFYVSMETPLKFPTLPYLLHTSILILWLACTYGPTDIKSGYSRLELKGTQIWTIGLCSFTLDKMCLTQGL